MFGRFLGVGLPAMLALLLSMSPGQVRQEGKPQIDPLPSWKEGPAKKAIVEFVQATTDKASPKYVPAEQRIATFDNDGTLWVEQPLYTQVVFALDRVIALAPQHPEWKTKEPFKAILEGDREAMAKFSKKDLLEIAGATHSGMTTEQFHALAKEWLATAKHPRYKRLYTECVYQPMLEVMAYLRANDFKTYIVTGGGQAFVRTFSQQVYGIPLNQVIGSAAKLKYTYRDSQPIMLRLPALLLLDDEEGKPEDIELFIGRKPLAAFGNSDGDRQMLEWTQSGAGARLMMLVHHDDAEREYAYGAKSKIGTFSEALMAEANKRGWTVISMKNDWQRVFPFGK
jgi:phosphoglycolate phosphatase-like HAD superfamily hydrolase